jgi:hypothetical protein
VCEKQHLSPILQGGSRSAARTALCGGRSAMVVPTATPEIILHKQTNNYGQIGYKGVLVESSCASGRTLPDLCRRPIFRTPDCMLLVALGLYSASYKAFMALRLKPLVPFLKFVALILFVNCSRSGLNVGLPAQIASYQTHLRQNNTVRTASYIDEPFRATPSGHSGNKNSSACPGSDATCDDPGTQRQKRGYGVQQLIPR